jgi:hypothetical protein
MPFHGYSRTPKQYFCSSRGVDSGSVHEEMAVYNKKVASVLAGASAKTSFRLNEAGFSALPTR